MSSLYIIILEADAFAFAAAAAAATQPCGRREADTQRLGESDAWRLALQSDAHVLVVAFANVAVVVHLAVRHATHLIPEERHSRFVIK